MHNPARKTAQEREHTAYEPEQVELEASTPEKSPKKKEEPDPGLTLGTDIEDYLEAEEKQVDIELDKVRMNKEKKSGQITWQDPKLLVKYIESLLAASPKRPIYVVLVEDNRLCVVSHARALAPRHLYHSEMAITGVYLDSTPSKWF